LFVFFSGVRKKSLPWGAQFVSFRFGLCNWRLRILFLVKGFGKEQFIIILTRKGGQDLDNRASEWHLV
jgi:hypothetical protein